jgi:hypothetical protein
VWWPASDEQGRPITGYAVVVVQAGVVRSWQNVGQGVRTATVTGLLPLVPATVLVIPYTDDGRLGQISTSPPTLTPTA